MKKIIILFFILQINLILFSTENNKILEKTESFLLFSDEIVTGLKLDIEQKEKMDEIITQFKREREIKLTEMSDIENKINGWLISDNPDTYSIEKFINLLFEQKKEYSINIVNTYYSIKNELTEEQQKQYANLRKEIINRQMKDNRGRQRPDRGRKPGSEMGGGGQRPVRGQSGSGARWN